MKKIIKNLWKNETFQRYLHSSIITFLSVFGGTILIFLSTVESFDAFVDGTFSAVLIGAGISAIRAASKGLYELAFVKNNNGDK